MAPQPVAVVDEEDSSYSDSAAAAAPLLNLRVYPSGGSDEDEDVDKILFEDAQEEEDDIHFIMSSPPGKVVKFADDVAEQQDAKRDHGKSRSELLTKIARLTDVLKDAEMAVDVEKEKRKKKEKNLLKLAKELKKRNQKREGDIERMEEVRLQPKNCQEFKYESLFLNATPLVLVEPIAGGKEALLGAPLDPRPERIGPREGIETQNPNGSKPRTRASCQR